MSSTTIERLGLFHILEPSRVNYKHILNFHTKQIKAKNKVFILTFLLIWIHEYKTHKTKDYTMAKEKLSYSEMNKSRVEKMLEKDAGSVKAVIANAIETKKVAGKLQILDIIFNNSRQNAGFKIKYTDAEALTDMFKEADQIFDNIIAKATELEIYTPRESRVSEFKQNREKILALLAEQKTSKEISEILKIDEAKTQAWVGQLEAEQVEQAEPKTLPKSKVKAA